MAEGSRILDRAPHGVKLGASRAGPGRHVVTSQCHALRGDYQRERDVVMPRSSKTEARVVVDNPVLTSRHVELDDFTVGFEEYHVNADGAPVFKGLPDDRCQCPHWGIVVSGELRLRYANGEDTYRAGDAYVARPGHVP